MAVKKSGTTTPEPEHPANELAKPDGAASAIPKPAPDPWATVVPVTALSSQDRLKCLLYGPNGCLSAETFIRYEIRNKDGNRQNNKGGSIEHLYRRFNGIMTPGKGFYQRPQTVGSEYFAPSIDVDGLVFLNRITNVVHSGIKPCITLRAANGWEITTTRDHKFWTGDKFVPAGTLVAGNVVHIHNNTYAEKDAETKKPERAFLYVKDHPTAGIKVVRDRNTGKAYEYRRLPRSRAVVEADMNGMTLDAYISVLNDGDVSGIKVLPYNVDVHHKDEDHTNDARSNLVVMSKNEHALHHAVERKFGRNYTSIPMEIVSIEDAGEMDTYDVCMEDPFNNFVADGFVVHNSGKSTTGARFRCPLIGLTEQQAVPAIKEANPNALIKVIKTPQDLLEFRQLTRSAQLGERVDAVVLDSLTDVQRILKDLYTGQQAKRKDVTDMETWGRIIDATARLAREMRDLPVHTLVICLDSEVEVEGEGVIHRPAVSGKALPNQLGQFFNLVGYISRQTRPSGTRREVMFEGPERYQTKRMTGIDDVEAPEPLMWISKRFGGDLTDAKDHNGKTIKERLADWSTRGSMESNVQPDVTNNNATTNTTNTGTVDPFAGA